MKKFLAGGGIILALFCISLIFFSNRPATKIIQAQTVAVAKINAVDFSAIDQVKTVQSNIGKSARLVTGGLSSSSRPSIMAGKDYIEGDVIIKYKKSKINLETAAGQVQANTFNAARKMEKREFSKKGNLSFLQIKDGKTTAQKIAELQADPNVEYAEPNYQRRPSVINTNDTYKNLLWGLDNTGQTVGGNFPDNNPRSGVVDADIDAPEAWQIADAATISPVIVAIIDNGVAYNHPDLVANMWDGSGCKDQNGAYLGGCSHGYDYVDNDKDPMPEAYSDLSVDMSSHATHVAGIIAAAKNNSKGVVGVASGAKIMTIRFKLDVASEIKAIDFAIQNGAKIINASFGSDGYSQAEYDAINRFSIAGGIFVAAAGNNGQNNDVLHNYPSDYNLDNIIAVTATNENDQLASFADYSATAVDVAAPGTNVYSTISEASVFNENFETTPTSEFPNGWVLGGINNQWKVYDTGDAFWGKVLHVARPNYPYAANANTTITSATYDFGTDAKSATISFAAACDTEYSWNADYLAVEYSADGVNFTEGTWPYYNQQFRLDETVLDWLTNDDSSAGGSAAYIGNIVIPKKYLTNNFKFRFRWVTNAADNNHGGCYVDQISIKKFTDGSNEPYGYLSGTSMATPYVAGLAALMEGYNSSLSAAQIKNIILTSGDDLVSLHGITSAGTRINAKKAMQAVEVLGQPKRIDSFAFSSLSVTAIIDEAQHTIAATVPYGTDVTALVPTISYFGTSISPNSGVAQNFSNPVSYMVTAADGTTQVYAVTVTISRSYIIDGSDAVDVIGQYQDVTANPALVTFNKNDVNNQGRNKLGLFSPVEVALDTVHHRLFVAEGVTNNRIMIYNLNSDNTLADYVPDHILGQTEYSSSTNGRSQNKFNTVDGLAYDSIGDRLFVSDSVNMRVLVYDTAVIADGENAVNVLGQADFSAAISTTTQYSLSQPAGLTYDLTNNRLFVADVTNNRVMVFNVATSTIANGQNAINVLGQTSFITKTYSASTSTMNYPRGVQYDAGNNRLFVADALNRRVLVFNAATSTITNGENASYVLGQANFSGSSSGHTQTTLNNPFRVTYDSVGSRLFVADQSNSRVMIFNVATSTIVNGQNAINVLGQTDFNASTSTVSQNRLKSLTGLVYNNVNNQLFVADSSNHRVVIFNAATSTISNGQNAVDLIGQYQDIIANPLVPNFNKSNTDNSYNPAINKFGLYTPRYLTIDPVHLRLFVTDNFNNRVLVYNLNADGSMASYTPTHVLGQASFTTTTATVMTQSSLKVPNGLAYDFARNYLFVNDAGNNRIMVFDVAEITNGEPAINVLCQADFVTKVSTSTQDHITNSSGFAYDFVHNRLFVNDYSRILVFDVAEITNGEPAINVLGQTDFTSNATATTQAGFDYILDSVYDWVNERLFVAERNNQRVTVFDVAEITNGEPAINVLGQSGYLTNSSATTNGGFKNISALAYDNISERLFVSEGGNNRVTVFDVAEIVNGELAVSVIGQDNYLTLSSGVSTKLLNSPWGIYYYENGNKLFVADSANNRVMVFAVGQTNIVHPVALSYYPQNNTTSTSISTNLQLRFSQPMAKGSGSIALYKTSNDLPLETIDVNSNQVNCSSTGLVTITPANVLAEQTDYYVKIDATALVGVGFAINNYLGITDATTWKFATSDLSGPTLSNIYPSGVQEYGTSSVNLTVTTNENSTCRYAAVSGTAFGAMTPFAVTGAINHKTPISSLTNGSSYTYYIVCQDLSNNTSTEAVASFSVAAVATDNDGPVISNILPDGEQVAGTVNATLVLDTDEAATCKYSDNFSTLFASMTIFSVTGLRHHTTPISGLSNGNSYVYYVICEDFVNNFSSKSTVSFSIALTVVAPPVSGGGGGGGGFIVPPVVSTTSYSIPTNGVSSIGTIGLLGTNLTASLNSVANFITTVSQSSQRQEHKMTVVNLDVTSQIVTLRVESTPQTIVLKLNEKANIDLDQDGKSDISINFSSLAFNQVSLTVKSLIAVQATIDSNGKNIVIPDKLGRIVKVSTVNRPAVYYVSDGLKYLFVNRNTYTTWANDIGDIGNKFSTLKQISQSEFEAIPLGGNLVARSGNLIKFDDSSIIYGVGAQGRLYKFVDASVQSRLYGKAVPYVVQAGFRNDYYNYGTAVETLTATSVKPE